MELNRATEIATTLMSIHGLSDWLFRLSKSKRCLGVCKAAQRTIELSAVYVFQNSEEHVRDTILHEIAHALVGIQHGHDTAWKEMCLNLGCQPKACDNTAVLPEGPWQARCPSCLGAFTRHRRPEQVAGMYCRKCGPERGRLLFKNLRKDNFRQVQPIRQANLKQPRQLTIPLGAAF
jgi:predicted SprT family Zn-dependent metalloprotease